MGITERMQVSDQLLANLRDKFTDVEIRLAAYWLKSASTAMTKDGDILAANALSVGMTCVMVVADQLESAREAGP